MNTDIFFTDSVIISINIIHLRISNLAAYTLLIQYVEDGRGRCKTGVVEVICKGTVTTRLGNQGNDSRH